MIPGSGIEKTDLKQDAAGVDTNHQLEQQVEELELDEQQHIHILAVDDSSIERKILEKLLTVSSYHVTCVDSGNKALEYLGLLDSTTSSIPYSSSSSSACSCESSPDSSPSSQDQKHLQGSKVNLIMTDYSMPGMNGYDLLRKVKGSTWKDIPVVVMSSENVPARINMCLEGGADEFILKPIQLSDLKKLQSHLLKPLIHSCENLDLVGKQNESNLDKDRDNCTNNNVTKRKAVSGERSEKRLQMKEVVVV